MTDKITQAIRDWHNRMTEIERVLDALDAAIGTDPESPLRAAIYGIADGYTKELSERYQLDGWLAWWWYECQLGAKPMQASLAGEAMRTIATIDDLIAVTLGYTEARQPRLSAD